MKQSYCFCAQHFSTMRSIHAWGFKSVVFIQLELHAVCELVYKPEARVEQKACRSIRIVCKVAQRVDLNFEVKF